jgi:signal transduction histidine kinase
VTRLNRIVDDVLDFARPVRLEYAPADLGVLCRDVVAATLPRSDAPRCRLTVDPGLAPVTIDAERLRTALVNILANARDAALARSARNGEGFAAEPAYDIEMRASAPHAGRVAVEVEDRGTGIDPADLPHVFDPYFTTKRTGSGLGLAIAKNIVDAMGGVISAQSQAGEGTRIRIELPAAPETHPQPAPAAGTPPAA